MEIHRVYLDGQAYEEYSAFPGRILAIYEEREEGEFFMTYMHVGHKFRNGDFKTFYHNYALVGVVPYLETMQ